MGKWIHIRNYQNAARAQSGSFCGSSRRPSRPWVMEGSPADEEAPKDPAAHDFNAAPVSDQEISGHRHLYVGVHAPGGKQHSEKHKNGPRHHHHHRNKHLKDHLKTPSEDQRPVTPPSQRVQFILGEEANGDESHQTHPIFSEMEELFMQEGGEMEWKETARWVKFEEDVEEGGNRWSKPHVATLSLHSLFELRSLILNGTVCLDMAATNLEEISELVLDNMINAGHLSYDKKEKVKDAMLKKHRHQFEGTKKNENSSSTNKMPLIRSLADIGKIHSNSKSMTRIKDLIHGIKSVPSNLSELSKEGTPGFHGNASEGNIPKNKSDDNFMKENDSSANLNQKVNSHFMKKIPKGAEASNILVGEVEFLEKPLSAFIRLADATMLGDLTEVPVPTRFLFVLLGPFGGIQKYHEIGRSIATIMSDEVFHDVAYKAKKRDHLLAGLDEFLDAVTVLPPGEWDPNIRIEPPSQVASQENRKHPHEEPKEVDEEEEEQKIREADGLTRTGRLFGGLINDIKRKKPFYLSDFKDGLSMQCIASYLFIYFSCLTPIITFGGLLGDATKERIASMESLVSGLLVGVTYGFFSGQPLTILGSTGPVLVFETIVFDFCWGQGWDYLSFRLWIGIWIGVFLLVLVALDASAFVCYITRFTEENFATLIAVIFIIKAVEKVLHIKDVYPLNPSPCFCDPINETVHESGWNFTVSEDFVSSNKTMTTPHGKAKMCNFTMDGVEVEGTEAVGCHYVPNAFLMSCLLFIGTFLISHHLKKFKAASFFPQMVRNYISDFAVVTAIISMSVVDMCMGVDTPKLNVPSNFAPTWDGRGWLIPPFTENNPVWTSVLAILPAMLGTILIFMDQQITAVIVNRKEFKLQKGCGYHLDLLIVALLIIVCSILGIPWFVAATVLALNHVKSLTRESSCAAPGEKPQFLGIREQRVTHIAIFLTVGLSVFLTPILKHIPMPVLYGVFLYMGVSALNGLQFFDRILLVLMPKKYQPDTPYLRQVSINRVHLYTSIQLMCFIALWLIKSFKQTSILFPLMLVVMIGIRKLLDFVFTKKELQILDDILPEFKRHERLDDEEALHQGTEPTATDELVNKKGGTETDRRASLRFTQSSVEIPMINGNVIKIPHNHEINITEEMNKSGLWNSLNKPSPTVNEGLKKRHKHDKHEKRKESTNNRERKMSLVEEGTEEDVGITIKTDTYRRSLKGSEEEIQSLVNSKSETSV